MKNNKMSPKEFRYFMEEQRHEIEKYKWCLGIELHHDPLNDRSLYEIAQEWLDKFAGRFRKEWEEKNVKKDGNENE
jgi:hypothetical protein